MTNDMLGRRAHTTDEMAQLHARLMSREDAMASIASYQPRASDVIITPAGKCGTTLLQQTFHCLRSRGDMDFDDISRVVPWIETSKALDLDINAEQRCEPRGFKSHLPWDHVPKGARYIVALRDPIDALVSMYRFMEGWFFEPGKISHDEFITAQVANRGQGTDHWAHLVGWWQQRDNPSVLLMSYEDMVANPETTIRKVADFCDIPLDDALIALTLEHSSRAFMLTHKDRFDDAMMRRASEQRCGLPTGSDSAKVRAAGSGARRNELSADLQQQLLDVWSSDVAPKIGLDSFADLAAALRG